VRLIATIIGLALIGGTAVAKEATAELKVPAMDCSACTVVIKRALTQTKGVKTVDLDVDKRLATVVYEDTQVTEPEIQKAIEKSGFKTEPGKK
jgi:copper chaperone CopZ